MSPSGIRPEWPGHPSVFLSFRPRDSPQPRASPYQGDLPTHALLTRRTDAMRGPLVIVRRDLSEGNLTPRTHHDHDPTSADAAGLPIFAGLARYDEVAAGAITHALRFTCPSTRRAYVPPARHHASSQTGANLPPMGMRVRLRASVDISTFPPDVQVILSALKRYGMILADNGGGFFVSGAPDPRWNDANIDGMKRIKGSDFEVVAMTGLVPGSP